MGQYYNIVLKEKGITTYNRRKVTGEGYQMVKLTEHSWLGNTLMDSVSAYIFGHRVRMLWLGDYAERDEVDGITNREVSYEKSWGNKELDPEEIELESTENRMEFPKSMFSYGGKYLVNHTKKVAVSFSDYRRKHYISRAKWVQHPLSLLTAVGNGRGGGDYSGPNEELVGSWAWDEISIESRIPFGYEKKDIWFKEDLIEGLEKECLEEREKRKSKKKKH